MAQKLLKDIEKFDPVCIYNVLHYCQNNHKDIPALPYCKVALRAQKPLSGAYPSQLKALGDHIRKRRLDLKITQEELAEKLGTTACSVHNWEKNRSDPSLAFIPKIIRFLGYVPYDISNLDFGKKIAARRRFLGLSQKDLARILGVDPCTIRSWEKGSHRPMKKLMKKLAAFFARSGLMD